MNIIAHGIDLVDCDRLAASVERLGEKFLDRVFTPTEQAYCMTRRKGRIQSLAGRFAVKEAVLKVLGTGWAEGMISLLLRRRWRSLSRGFECG